MHWINDHKRFILVWYGDKFENFVTLKFYRLILRGEEKIKKGKKNKKHTGHR